jgi:hypothetical protein
VVDGDRRGGDRSEDEERMSGGAEAIRVRVSGKRNVTVSRLGAAGATVQCV